MQHEHRAASAFSPREREALHAIATAVMPPGRRVPGADGRCVDRFEQIVSQIGGGAISAARALIAALDAESYARRLRPLARVSEERRRAILEGWRTGGYLRRTALRALLTPLKLAHFDDVALWRDLGCVFPAVEAPATIDRPRWMSERVTRGADVVADEELECDVVVIGTGAGGAVVARELVEQGLTVVVLEEGDYFDRRDFNGRASEMHAKLYRNLLENTTVGNTSIYVPVGRSVGGTTTINSGTCYRTPDRVLRKWREEFGLVELTPEGMAPYFERVEDVLGVAPAAPDLLGGAADAIARGCRALGYRHAPLRRNAPACDGKGVCCFGCPTDAKRSTNVSYVPLALRAGAHLFAGVKAERVLVENGRAAGVVARARKGGGKLTVRARATVVACGTFYTPVLLAASGVASPQLGRNLSLHPAAAVAALFDAPTRGWSGIPQSYAIEEFHDEGILFEGGTPPLEMAASALPMIGERLMEICESFDRAVLFGFMIEDSSRGRVHVRNGRPIVTYVMNDQDVALIKRGIDILARVYFAAGARSVLSGVHGFDEIRGEEDLARFRRAKISARDYMLSAYHPLGSARLGVDPAASVIGPDHQVHGARDLYVVDGSAIPSSPAVNPQVTIMALATRAAERLARKLLD
jgi:choline dehydrogenase-like flavoprotein